MAGESRQILTKEKKIVVVEILVYLRFKLNLFKNKPNLFI